MDRSMTELRNDVMLFCDAVARLMSISSDLLF